MHQCMEQLLHTSLPAVLGSPGGGPGGGLGWGTGDGTGVGVGTVREESGSEVREYSKYKNLHNFFILSLLNTSF